MIGSYQLSKGGITGTIADVRLILSVALKTLAIELILAHNHPSGNLKPSEADKQITSKIRQAAKLLDIELIDHIIISNEGYYSFMMKVLSIEGKSIFQILSYSSCAHLLIFRLA